MQKTLSKCAKALPVILLVGVFLVLFGCLTVDMRTNIASDGSRSGTMSMRWDLKPLTAVMMNVSESDFSAQYAALDSATKAQMDAGMKAESCANMSASYNLTNVKCDVKDMILTLSGDAKVLKLTEKDGFTKTAGLLETTYTYTSLNDTFSSGMTPDTVQQLEEYKSRANATMYIQMPGSIFEATNGKIVNGVAVYDMLDLMIKGKAPIVKSKETNLPVVGGIVVVVLIVIVGAYMMMSKKPAKK
jgi:hypothetical protein